MEITYKTEISTAALKYSLEVPLICGLITVESQFDRWAIRTEREYRYFWNVKANTPFRALTGPELDARRAPSGFTSLQGNADQEWWAQSTSWGLMQIMGAVAREHGYRANFLSQLCNVQDNLDVGCRFLRSLVDWAQGDMERAFCAYNGGKSGNVSRPFRNAAYAARVIASADAYKLA